MISSRRKQLNLTRKQVAQAINANEEDVKMIENGIIPQSDYILINKLEGYLKLSLRRDTGKYSSSLRGVSPGEHKEISKPKWVGRVGAIGSDGSKAGAEKILEEGIELADEMDEK